MTVSSRPWAMGATLSLLLLGAVACSDDGGALSSGDGPLIMGDTTAPSPDAGPAPDLGPTSLTCTPPNCPACVGGKTGCAAKGPYLAGTCCARGDNLALVGSGQANEVVDVETNGTFAVTCGGFGADINNISSPTSVFHINGVTKRCQRAAFGPKLSNGAQVIYLAHHGDSYIPTPYIKTVHVMPSREVTVKHTLSNKKALFEGMLYHGGKLYVAAHAGGVRVYELDTIGAPQHKGTVSGGIKNAWKLAAHKDRLFVADQGAGLQVFSLAKPLAPARLHTVATIGSPRDVVVDGARAYVAMGGAGVDVFDISDASKAPARVATIKTEGSAQSVAISGGVLAVAAWSHVAIYDARTFTLLGTERVRKAFEQDLAVAMHGDRVLVGEWERLYVLEHRQGLVAPDLFVSEEIFTLEPGKSASRAVRVKNIGFTELEVSSISANDKAFTIKNGSFKLAPGKAEVFEFAYTPPAASTKVSLTLTSNDPDKYQAKLEIPVELKQSAGLNVGDTLDSSFGFLDPSGAGQLSGLKGKVTILAYFAMF